MMESKESQAQHELSDFLTFLFEETNGYVYSATKDINDGAWNTFFFKWPSQRDDLIEHIETNKSSREVYVAPSLFRTTAATKESWLGSHVVWAEFDYGPPSGDVLPGSTPNPHYRVQSSDDGHEHWYWKLDHFLDASNVFEEASRRIAYGLESDLGTWNCNRVLRPPTTVHHESGLHVRTISSDVERSQTQISEFAGLPNPPTGDVTIEGQVPEVIDVIARYEWPSLTFKRFRQKSPTGDRSNALCWLAYECADMGMSNVEILSVILNADDRWGKFKGRNDRMSQLTAIVARARLKYPSEETISNKNQSSLPLVGFHSFVLREIKLDWVFEGVLAKEMLAYIASKPGIGKTQLTLQIALHLAIGKPFLNFKPVRPMKSIFSSLEMGEKALHQFASTMAQGFTDAELRMAEENLILMPLGHGLALNREKDQLKLIEAIDMMKPDGLFIDSVTTSVSGSTNDDDHMMAAVSFYREQLLMKRNMFTWLIHHFRKEQVGNKRADKMDDLRGSGVVSSQADMLMSLWEEEKGGPINVSWLKTRLTAAIPSFDIVRDENLSFGFAPTGGEVRIPIEVGNGLSI